MIYTSRISSSLLGVFFLLALSALNAQKFLDDAFANIRSHVRAYQPPKIGNVCRSVNCCTITDTSSCNLASFPKDKTTLVYPGGDTRCIYSYSSAFAFQVIPGDSDKLLVYFQGGGACWDEISTNAGFCSSDAVPSDLVGIFDHSQANNPYKSYTVVQVLYCSGDLHAGNTTRDYTDDEGEPIVQVGIKNTNAVLDWIKQQQSSGQLASSLTDVVVMGCSAGSIGTQIWGQTVLESLSWQNAAVIPDSYAGVFPEGTQGPLIYGFGACEVVDESLQASCEAQTLTLQDITETSMQQMNGWEQKVPFSFIQSKADGVQISFYVAVGALTPDSTAAITPEEFYAEVNRIFERYNSNVNFVNYMVDGNKHCFTNSGVVYTADTTGPAGTPSSGEPTMTSWIGTMPLANGVATTTDCYGTLLNEADWTGTTYCDASLAGKSYA